MNNSSFEVIKLNISNTQNVIRGDDIYYQCTKCHSIISSIPKTSTNCQCGNIGIDKDLNRLFVEDFSQFIILRKKKLISRIFSPIKKILFYFGLLSAFFFMIWIWPHAVGTLSIIIIVVCIGIILLPLLRGNYRFYKKGEYSKSIFLRKSGMDAAGILLITLLAIFLASVSARYIGQIVGNAAEISKPGLGYPASIFSGIIAAVLVGLCVGYIARTIWSPITKIIIGSQLSDHRNYEDAK